MKYAQFREIETERLRLRKLRKEDTRDYYDRLGSSEAVTRFMLWNPHESYSESVASIEKTLRRYEAGGCYRWGIALKEDDRIIGVVELLRIDEERQTCSFAYMLGEVFWGRGFGTEALRAALDFAFAQLGVEAVEADHMAGNEASGAVMAKAGMVYTGTEKGKYKKNGILFDAPGYRIDRNMWEKKQPDLDEHPAH